MGRDIEMYYDGEPSEVVSGFLVEAAQLSPEQEAARISNNLAVLEQVAGTTFARLDDIDWHAPGLKGVPTQQSQRDWLLHLQSDDSALPHPLRKNGWLLDTDGDGSLYLLQDGTRTFRAAGLADGQIYNQDLTLHDIACAPQAHFNTVLYALSSLASPSDR